MTPRAPLCWFSLATLALAVLACDEGLPKATEIERMRLLGARVEVEGDPTRATPRPGETANVRFVAVHPTLAAGNEGVQTMLASCTQPERYTGGVPICRELLDAALAGSGGPVDLEKECRPEGPDGPNLCRLNCADLGSGVLDAADFVPELERGKMMLRCVDGEPDISLRAAPTFEAEQMLYRGVVCEDGRAFIDLVDPALFGCDRNEGESFRVHGTVTVQHEEGDRNLNPSFDEAHFLFGSPGQERGRPWVPVPTDALPAEDDCWEASEGTALVQADSFGSHQIAVRYQPDAREEVDGEPEDVEISLFATAGELEQRFVLFDAHDVPETVDVPVWCASDDDCARSRASCDDVRGVCVAADPETGEDNVVFAQARYFEDTVSWTPPIAIESRSQIVRFFFTVLDRRGGFDWTTRAICLR